MAIQGVDTKCYILALFIRDDNQRFLLGSGRYEFKDSQKQFSANTIQNDVVEVQGNDGYLLAGQVRRSGTQSFDGYIGDGTTAKTDVETYRRDFFSFFRKNFFYRVVYVFPDGTAIQRKRGFLVDDPTVEELYQQYPEYHVALNFEDVNYYTYSENGSGEEIYAEEAQIDLSMLTATGGLVWDEYGAVSDSYGWGDPVEVSGNDFEIINQLSAPTPITDLQLQGDTYQQTYSGKNLFGFPEESYVNNGVTWQRDSATNTAHGTGTITQTYSTAVANITFPNSLPAGTYTFSIAEPLPSPYRLEMSTYDINNTRRNYTMPAGASSMTISPATALDRANVAIIGATTGTTVDITIKNFQLEVGSTATDFEPYVGGTPTPNPDHPQEVQTVTGEQTVIISDGNNQSQSYTVSLGTTELCKIGDYQDYIYKDDGNWYVHKEIGKQSINGSETWTITYSKTDFIYYQTTAYTFVSTDASATPTALATQLLANNGNTLYNSNTASGFTFNTSGYIRANLPKADFADATAVKNHFTANPMDVYYALATPTNTQITDTTLIGQLEAIEAMKLFVGENNLLVASTGTNLPATLDLKYYTSISIDGAGYVWEEGGTGGPTVVNIDSITNVYPIWTVTGPAVNPELSVITTNTTLIYNGTVASNQTLVIDMMNKTAKLNGSSVIGNVTGDWVNFAPGANRVIYATDNAEAPSSLIQWQEVVG